MDSHEYEPSLDLLRTLSNSEFRSGQSVAEQLGVSRAAVWKRVRKLSHLGIQVERSRGHGYRLAEALELLDPSCIENLVRTTGSDSPEVEVSPVCVSTNTQLLYQMRLGEVSSPAVLLAEMQTGGRGRRGRKWNSPFGRNIYLSYGWHCSLGINHLSGLSLAVGVILANALTSETGLPIALKWPNDLLLDGEKCGGVLIDIDGDLEGSFNVVIGVGLNLAMSDTDGALIDQPWTDLKRHVDKPLSRNSIAACLIRELRSGLARFETHGFSVFLERYLAHDVLLGKQVIVTRPGKAYHGRAAGVSTAGGLLVQVDDEIVEFNSGDVSLRLQ